MPRRGSHLGSLTWLCSSASDSGSDSPLALGASPPRSRDEFRAQVARLIETPLFLYFDFVFILYGPDRRLCHCQVIIMIRPIINIYHHHSYYSRALAAHLPGPPRPADWEDGITGTLPLVCGHADASKRRRTICDLTANIRTNKGIATLTVARLTVSRRSSHVVL